MDNMISIFKLLKEKQPDASLIASFNVFFPFYEEYILRKLQSGGSRNNILIMDASQLQKCMTTPSMRPVRAGKDYTLIPVHMPSGVFHPKILFFCKKKELNLIVGSHNVTLSGYGRNRELTTVINVVKSLDEQDAPVAIDCWRYLTDLIKSQKKYLPQSTVEIFHDFMKSSPVLNNSSTQASPGAHFIGQPSSNGSLMELLLQEISGPVRKVLSVGPFFDKRLSFLYELQDALSPNEMIIGVDPNTVTLDYDSPIDDFFFVDASGLGDSDGYLHAKALYIEDEGDNSWLAIGSANPSAPAWLTNARSNAEAVILHGPDSAKEIATQLGLLALNKKQQLNSVELRKAISLNSKTDNQSYTKSKTLLVEIIDNTFLLPESILELGPIAEATLLDSKLESLSDVLVNKDDILSLKTDVQFGGTTFLNIIFQSGEQCLAIVHQTKQILQSCQSKLRTSFERTFSSLGSINPEVVTLIESITHIVTGIPTTSPRLRKKGLTTKEDRDKNVVLSTLLTHYTQRPPANKVCSYRSGDLSYILDVLIRKLGIGNDNVSDSNDLFGRNEEEQVGQDDGIEHPISQHPSNLITESHNRINSLIRNLSEQLKQTVEQDDQYIIGLMKINATLALLKELRKAERNFPWLSKGETIFPQKARRELFKVCIENLFKREKALYIGALCESITINYDDITHTIELLLWLAYDGGFSSFERIPYSEQYTTISSNGERKTNSIIAFERSLLAPILPLMAGSDIDRSRLESYCFETTDASNVYNVDQWLNSHFRKGIFIKAILENENVPSKVRGTRIGDYAVYNSGKTQVPYIIKSSEGKNIRLFDFDIDHHITISNEKVMIFEGDNNRGNF